MPLSSAVSSNGIHAGRVRVAGKLTHKALRKITRRVRSSVLGPTSVYYAGVTAPAIAAGMAAVSSSALERAGMDSYWVLLTSGIIASMAGISWYLIFMRLSYRHSAGRATESEISTQVEADELGIYWQRGEARGRINWNGVDAIDTYRSFLHIRMRDAGDIFLPVSWFANLSEMKAFAETLRQMKHSANEVVAV